MDRSPVSVTAHYTACAYWKAGIPETEGLVTPVGRLLFGVGDRLVRPFSRLFHAPDLSMVVPQRHMAIDQLLRRSGVTQIVELGAGLSRRGLRFAEDPDLRYLETDLPPMVRAKESLFGGATRPSNHRLMALDASRPDLADTLAPVLDSAPTAIVAEGLLAYFTPADQERTWSEIADLLGRLGGGFWVGDVYHRRDFEDYRLAADLFLMVLRGLTRTRVILEFDTHDQTRETLLSLGFKRVELFHPDELGLGIRCKETPVRICVAHVAA